MNYLDHSFNFFRRDWPGAALLSQQIHDMGGELITCLEQKQRAFGFILFVTVVENKSIAN